MLNLPVDEIKKRIQDQSELSASDIDERVEKKMKQLSGLISEEGALHIIANELNVKMVPDKDDRKINDLMPGMRDVEQAMRVVQAYELNTFESKFGDGEGKVFSFLAGDESGVIRVTCWGPRAEEAKDLEQGQIVKVKNAYIKENNGRSELHLNNNSTIEIDPEGVEVGDAPERPSGEYERKAINELSKGDYRVELVGTVVQAYDPRFFERKNDGGEGVVANILIDDGTANVRIGCFDKLVHEIFDMSKDEVFANKDGSWEEPKTELLGEIVKVKGRAKLNTVYNTIEVTADEIDTSPDANEELERMKAKDDGTQETVPSDENISEASAHDDDASVEEHLADEIKEDDPEGKKESAPANKDKAEAQPKDSSSDSKKQSEDVDEEPIDIDDLDDLDFDDIEEL